LSQPFSYQSELVSHKFYDSHGTANQFRVKCTVERVSILNLNLAHRRKCEHISHCVPLRHRLQILLWVREPKIWFILWSGRKNLQNYRSFWIYFYHIPGRFSII